MSWAKIDDKFFAHPKVTRISFGARGLWVTALSWCASLETDGFLPLDTLSLFASTESQQSYAALADELVRTGLWLEACTHGVRGYQVHDFEVYNPSRKSLMSRRKREAARLRAYRNRTSVRSESVRVSRPGPTRPDPSRPEKTDKDLSLASLAPPPENRFEEFWTLYPRHEGKSAARKAWTKLEPRPPLEAIRTALAWQRESPRWQEDAGRFIPHPATYLNGRRWEDEPPPRQVAGITTRTAGNLTAIARGLGLT